MQDRCDYSQVTIPNDRSYIPVAKAYVVGVAARLGFDAHDIETIERSVEEAVSNVIEHAFEPHEKASLDISCERAPLGLQVVIKDQGMPFAPDLDECPAPGSEPVPGSSCGPGISLMRDLMDEVHFHNLGRDGKEVVLIKYMRNASLADYYDACELEPYASPVDATARFTSAVEITVRPMDASEAIEVSRCVYRAYGYSYGFEHLYYPQRIVELNKSGTLFSVVAVTQEHEVVGHAALIRYDNAGHIAEMGMAAVKPHFRSQGILTRLSQFIVEKARSEGLMGIYGRAVTNHTYSQQVGLRLGLKDCALTLGFVPATASFKGITERLPQRDSTVTHFMYLHKPDGLNLYPPSRHREIIIKLYRHMGISSEINFPEGASADPAGTESPRNNRSLRAASLLDPTRSTASPLPRKGGVEQRSHSSRNMAKEPLAGETATVSARESVVRTITLVSLKYARIDVERYGADVVRQVKARLKELCLKQCEVINLYLNLADPLTGSLAGEFEDLGFFFAGLLPGGCASDALIFQYLNNVPIDYHKIKVRSEMGRTLLDYVKRCDPNA